MKKDKLVCGCSNITVQSLINAIENGASSFEEVQVATRVGTSCKRCLDSVKRVVDELLAE